MTGSAATSAAIFPGSPFGASRAPTPPRGSRASGSASQSDSGTMTGPSAGRSESDAAARNSVQRSSTTARSLMSFGIDALFEGIDAHATHGVDEPLVLVTNVEIGLDQPGDD